MLSIVFGETFVCPYPVVLILIDIRGKPTVQEAHVTVILGCRPNVFRNRTIVLQNAVTLLFASLRRPSLREPFTLQFGTTFGRKSNTRVLPILQNRVPRWVIIVLDARLSFPCLF